MGRNPSGAYQDAAGLLAEIAGQLPENGFDDRRRDARAAFLAHGLRAASGVGRRSRR